MFFLASTTFARDEVELDLTLPEAQSGAPGQDGQMLVINVRRDGNVSVNGRAVTIEGLRQRLRAAQARDHDQEVLIRGDTEVNFGVVARSGPARISRQPRPDKCSKIGLV